MAKSKKGVAGNKTGARARKAIRDAQNRGRTIKEIARAARRSEATINDILNKDIKNPPANVAARINKLKAKK